MLWNVNSGLLTGVMVGVYELLLLPIVDWSLQKVCRLMNVRALERHGTGEILESPLPFSGTPYICLRKRDSWMIYVARLVPFALVTVWGFLVSSESVTRTSIASATVLVPGDGTFEFAVSETSVRRSGRLEWFCTAGKDVFLQTEDGKCTTTKVFSDLGTNAAYQEIIEECEVGTEEMPEEVAGVGNPTLTIAQCKEGRFYSIWHDLANADTTLFQIVENRIYVAQVYSEIILTEDGTLVAGIGSMKGVEVHFKGWDARGVVRAIMTNAQVRRMGVLKMVAAALLVPRKDVVVELTGDSKVVTRVNTGMLAVTIGLGGVVVLFFVIGMVSEMKVRRSYKVNAISSALEIASLAVWGSNHGKVGRTRIVMKQHGGVAEQGIERWDKSLANEAPEMDAYSDDRH